MKKIMIAAAALVAMTACNKTLIEGPVADSEYGYINFGLSSDLEIVDTKAATTVAKDNSTYNVYLKQGNNDLWNSKVGDKDVNYVEYKDINDNHLKKPAGTYTIVAENLTETEAEVGYGLLRVQGSASVTVQAGVTSNKVTVTCNPVNAKVTVGFDDTENTFAGATVKLFDQNGDQSRELAMTPVTVTTKDEKYLHDVGSATNAVAFFNVGSDNTASINCVITATIQNVSKTFTRTISVKGNTWNMITFKIGKDGNITFDIAADTEIKDSESIDTPIDPLNPDSKN